MKFSFPVSNNEAKYEALLAGLRIACSLKITYLRVRSDPQIVICQVTGDFEAKEDKQKYLRCVCNLASGFQQILFQKLPCEENVRADILSKLSVGEPMEGTWMESLQEKCISNEIGVLELSEDWTQPMKDFILEEKLPEEEKQARKIRTTSSKYVLINNQLHRTMGNQPLLKYFSGEDGKYVLQEIHEGIWYDSNQACEYGEFPRIGYEVESKKDGRGNLRKQVWKILKLQKNQRKERVYLAAGGRVHLIIHGRALLMKGSWHKTYRRWQVHPIISGRVLGGILVERPTYRSRQDEAYRQRQLSDG